MIMSLYWERSGAIPLSGKLRSQLEHERGVSFARASGLRLVARQRQDGDRAITDFRVFDPASVENTAREPRRYDDLDAATILYAGHIEPDGTIFLST